MSKRKVNRIKSSVFFEEWANYKIDLLLNIIDEIKDRADKSTWPEWQNSWFTYYDQCNKDTAVLHSSWNDFFNARSKDIEMFSKCDSLGYSYLSYDDIMNDNGIYKVLREECKYSIKIIELCLKKEGTGMLSFIEDMIDNISSTFSQLYGRNRLKWEQKQTKSNSGSGQKAAKEKRLTLLIESLKKYVNRDNEEIHINKNTFRKLVDKTFEELENYPRHYNTVKKYSEEAGEKMGKKIILKKTDKKVS